MTTDSEKILPLVNGNNQFAFSLFKNMATKYPHNILFSPFCINTVLSMTFAGARGITAKEMHKVLNIEGLSDNEFHLLFKELLAPILENEDPNIALHVVNRMYVQKNFVILTEFQKFLERHYMTTVASVDFAKKTEAVKKEINEWVAAQTHQKIKTLIGSESTVLDAMTRLILVNAVYFKGDWKNKFNLELTHPGDFHLDLNKVVTVNMMFQKGRFPYVYSDELNCCMLEIPYVNENFSMALILPSDIDGLHNLESNLDHENFQILVSSLNEVKLDVCLPKFIMDCDIGLADSLSELGMTSLFTNAANLSKITGDEDLHVSTILNKAFLEVNEEGSEAVASTGVVATARSALFGPQFIANHPFLLLIRHLASGIILFIGRVSDPSKP